MAARARTVGERREAHAARRQRRAEVTDPDIVMEAAAAFLAVRQRSEAETSRRLRHLGYPGELVDATVARLVTLGYLDDAAFARSWVESRDRARPRGEVALRRELTDKGIAADTIVQVLAERDERSQAAMDDGTHGPDADRAAAALLLQRRAATIRREPDPRRRRQRAYALLARNGFAPDICHEMAAAVGGDEETRAP